ncbi:MAG: Bro-N domain-containing protein [Patescibacteria group bacterium]|nr:Bro-N domain-containing protein [Patescibacteria group bacterium]MCL5431804.1 Bro-N domain-containing protein [Patescibacteria group bacterium]
MTNTAKISLFKGRQIRRLWVEKEEKWYFSVVDVVGALTGSENPRKYWNKLAERLRSEGSQSVTKCHQLKLLAPDGKYYLTDAADTETLFRLIQSIPSPNAEPFKLWLARVGYERVEESQDPELAINKAVVSPKPPATNSNPAWVNQSFPKPSFSIDKIVNL